MRSVQGPDKILTFGADVCADLDNFKAENLGMYVSQSGRFWGKAKLIRFRRTRKIYIIKIFRGLCHLCS